MATCGRGPALSSEATLAASRPPASSPLAYVGFTGGLNAENVPVSVVCRQHSRGTMLLSFHESVPTGSPGSAVAGMEERATRRRLKLPPKLLWQIICNIFKASSWEEYHTPCQAGMLLQKDKFPLVRLKDCTVPRFPFWPWQPEGQGQTAPTQCSFLPRLPGPIISFPFRLLIALNLIKSDLLYTCFTEGHLKSFLEIMTNTRNKWITKFQRKGKLNQSTCPLACPSASSPRWKASMQGWVTCRPLGLIQTVTFWA